MGVIPANNSFVPKQLDLVICLRLLKYMQESQKMIATVEALETRVWKNALEVSKG